MIITAMAVLYSEKVGGFCLVCSDSDVTRLATRLREAGMKVYGMGEKKTPNSFIVACDKFIFIEILKHITEESTSTASTKSSVPKNNYDNTTQKEIKFIAATIEDVADDEGWAFLGDVGSVLLKK
jgi:hypothetical protein